MVTLEQEFTAAHKDTISLVTEVMTKADTDIDKYQHHSCTSASDTETLSTEIQRQCMLARELKQHGNLKKFIL